LINRYRPAQGDSSPAGRVTGTEPGMAKESSARRRYAVARHCNAGSAGLLPVRLVIAKHRYGREYSGAREDIQRDRLAAPPHEGRP
jgi:hypothetical protein